MIEYIDENLNTAYIHPHEVKQVLPSSRPDICACSIIPINGAAIRSFTEPNVLNQRIRDWFIADDYQQRALGGGDYAQRRVDQLEGLVRYLMGTCRDLDDDLARFIHGKLEHTLNNPPFSERSKNGL